LAAEGWALGAFATADISTMFGGDPREMVISLERDA
jgi:hypothetical protein